MVGLLTDTIAWIIFELQISVSRVKILFGNYRIEQNSGGVKLWWISDFKVLARKTLANAQHLYYWQEKNFGEFEGK